MPDPMVPVAVESETGAQLLPLTRATSRSLYAWTAHNACDADQRAKYPELAEAAARIKIIYPEGKTDEE